MKKSTLSFKFSLMFAAFTLITLAISSILSYMNQMRLYKSQREESIQFVASYLEELLVADDIYFVWYQDYFLKKAETLLVPHDFDSMAVQDARHEYEEALAKDFPGKVLGTDIEFEELSEKTKDAYEIYSHEYYLAAFEKAREMFDLASIYYIVPKNDGSENVVLVLDSVREEKAHNGKKYINLGIAKNYPKEEHERLWEAWNTGKRPSGYDIFESKKGKTYAYYTPLFINGQKLGVIDVEVEVSTVTNAIIMATIRQMLMIGVILVLSMILLLVFIRMHYIKKLVKLQKSIEDYSVHKDPKIAESLIEEVTNKDEISSIMAKLAEMIYELESYMRNLTKTQHDLHDSQKKALEMSELAIKDTLTGIRNKTGYDKEVQKIKWEMAGGLKKIGVAMIDLNFLKKINDTFGHEKGNIAIISLCKIVCHIFEHSPVFRIGGDEFVVILKGQDLEHIDELIAEFYAQIARIQSDSTLEYWGKTSAAIGYSLYDPEKDSSYENIFKRADAEMYKAKKEMKAMRKN